MKVLVTGANGFVGGAICRILEGDNFDVIKIGGKSVEKDKSGTEISERKISVDIAETHSVAELEIFRDVEIIVHCAGLAHQFGKLKKEPFYKINVEGTRNIAELAAKLNVRRLILISSVAVYGSGWAVGEQDSSYDEEKIICRPKGFYAGSKLESEQTAISICRRNNVNLTVLRLATVVGENDAGNFYRLINAVYQRRFVSIGSGENKKSIIYKDDAGRACAEIIRRSEKKLEVYNVSAEALRVGEITEIIGQALHRKIIKLNRLTNILRIFIRANQNTLKLKFIGNLSQTLEKWLSDDVYPADNFKRDYGFEPAVSASEALRRECARYLETKC